MYYGSGTATAHMTCAQQASGQPADAAAQELA